MVEQGVGLLRSPAYSLRAGEARCKVASCTLFPSLRELLSKCHLGRTTLEASQGSFGAAGWRGASRRSTVDRAPRTLVEVSPHMAAPLRPRAPCMMTRSPTPVVNTLLWPKTTRRLSAGAHHPPGPFSILQLASIPVWPQGTIIRRPATHSRALKHLREELPCWNGGRRVGPTRSWRSGWER